MPIYEYSCAACGEHFSKLQKLGGEATVCPACGSSEVGRTIAVCAIDGKSSGSTGGGDGG